MPLEQLNLPRFLRALLAFVWPVFPDAASAQRRGGAGECRSVSERQGPANVWWGRFSGGRQAVAGPLAVEYRTTEARFVSRGACETWLYQLKSEYSYMPRWNECRRGYMPGAPAPPWWGPKRR